MDSSVKTAWLEYAYFLRMPKNMRSLEVSSGGFSAPCAVDIVLESVDAVLGVAELLGEGSREDSTDEAIAMGVYLRNSKGLEYELVDDLAWSPAETAEGLSSIGTSLLP